MREKKGQYFGFKVATEAGDSGEDSSNREQGPDSTQSFYSQRHLRPGNLSPLRKKLEKQLYDLKEVNQKGTVKPPLERYPAGEYVHTNPLVRGKG